MHAVVKIGPAQYLVTPGQEILVAGSGAEPAQVLLVSDGEKTSVGQPTVAKGKVTTEILGQVKGRKIRVAKYRAKSRYRRVVGFRPLLTRVKIDSISTS